MAIIFVGSSGVTDNGRRTAKFPVGTTAERPSSPEKGMIRINTDNKQVEYYDGTEWKVISE